MYKSFLTVLCISFIITSCNNTPNPFEISKQHVGLLTDSTQVKDLKTIYANDSIVKFISGDEFTGNINNIEIFEKGGKKLLTLTPKQALDSTSTIGSIRILDERFKTENNITSLSTFKDIKENHKISRISNLINSIVVGVDQINASFTIDKNELPSNLRFDMNLKFEPTHIPDNAKVKYFFINWNH
ncbi:hypothetical protein [Algibacter pectinivorans]|uniref:Uncharacterized protein n=1 Tax=Algibacter pectinivorans TaxID=870482 RepID=A0A1I1M8B2_9FLAO|nr:hypothetical protein [Algibacter pectinivorans]SFC81455.1 hypothetical protein SAMN04487987_10188 [Algibacter pectinivorans]